MPNIHCPSKAFGIGDYRGGPHFGGCFYPHDYAMSHCLNGWQRLWLFISFIWLVPTLSIAVIVLIQDVRDYFSVPTVEIKLSDGTSVTDVPFNLSVGEFTARLKRNGMNVPAYDMPDNTLVGAFPICGMAEQKLPVFCRGIIPHDLLGLIPLPFEGKPLRFASLQNFALAIMLAIMPPAFVYFLGLGITWVRAGFKNRKS